MEVKTPSVLSPGSNTVVWARLEANRLVRVGIPERGSTHVDRIRKVINTRENRQNFEPVITALPRTRPGSSGSDPHRVMGANLSQSLAPFTTAGKPTCGYYFSRSTDHTRRKFGIPPADLVKWRTQGKNKKNDVK